MGNGKLFQPCLGLGITLGLRITGVSILGGLLGALLLIGFPAAAGRKGQGYHGDQQDTKESFQSSFHRSSSLSK